MAHWIGSDERHQKEKEQDFGLKRHRLGRQARAVEFPGSCGPSHGMEARLHCAVAVGLSERWRWEALGIGTKIRALRLSPHALIYGGKT